MRVAILLLLLASCDQLCPRSQSTSSSSFEAVSPLGVVTNVASSPDRTVVVRQGTAFDVDVETLSASGSHTTTVPLPAWSVVHTGTHGPSPGMAMSPSSTLVVGWASLHPQENGVQGEVAATAVVDASGALQRGITLLDTVYTSEPAVAFDGEEYVVAYLTATSVRVARFTASGELIGTSDVAPRDDSHQYTHTIPLIASGAGRSWIGWPGVDGYLDLVLVEHGTTVTTTSVPMRAISLVQLGGTMAGALLMGTETAGEWDALPLGWDGEIGAAHRLQFKSFAQLTAMNETTFAALDESSLSSRTSVAAAVTMLSATGDIVGTSDIRNYRVELATSSSGLVWTGRTFDSASNTEYLQLQRRATDGLVDTTELDSTEWETVTTKSCTDETY
ncbi:MAG TPA: hypothetical protein VGM39_15535 [Kofleriaceae bacterium]|jgi:hypothetical protein